MSNIYANATGSYQDAAGGFFAAMNAAMRPAGGKLTPDGRAEYAFASKDAYVSKDANVSADAYVSKDAYAPAGAYVSVDANAPVGGAAFSSVLTDSFAARRGAGAAQRARDAISDLTRYGSAGAAKANAGQYAERVSGERNAGERAAGNRADAGRPLAERGGAKTRSNPEHARRARGPAGVTTANNKRGAANGEIGGGDIRPAGANPDANREARARAAKQSGTGCGGNDGASGKSRENRCVSSAGDNQSAAFAEAVAALPGLAGNGAAGAHAGPGGVNGAAETGAGTEAAAVAGPELLSGNDGYDAVFNILNEYLQDLQNDGGSAGAGAKMSDTAGAAGSQSAASAGESARTEAGGYGAGGAAPGSQNAFGPVSASDMEAELSSVTGKAVKLSVAAAGKNRAGVPGSAVLSGGETFAESAPETGAADGGTLAEADMPRGFFGGYASAEAEATAQAENPYAVRELSATGGARASDVTAATFKAPGADAKDGASPEYANKGVFGADTASSAGGNTGAGLSDTSGARDHAGASSAPNDEAGANAAAEAGERQFSALFSKNQRSAEPYGFYESVRNEARLTVGAQKHEFVMQLKPEHLGRLTMQIITENGVVSARLYTENEAARESLEANIGLLSKALAEQGLQIQGCTVEVRQGGDLTPGGRDLNGAGRHAGSAGGPAGGSDAAGPPDAGRLAFLRDVYFSQQSSVNYTV